MRILLFGGTSEARELVDFFIENKIKTTVCVTTSHALELLNKSAGINVIVKKQEIDEIAEMISKHDLIIDATHPYANIISSNIIEANTLLLKPYFRIVRDFFSIDNGLVFDDLKSICLYLNNKEGNVLVTTGSKELAPYTKINGYRDRLYFRVLPLISSIQSCLDFNITSDHIIALQGPFSEELNNVLIKDYNIKYLVTKDSGKNGGLYQKMLSAKKMGITLLVLQKVMENGFSIEEMKVIIKNNIDGRK